MNFQPSSLDPQSAVHLHIERLVIDGLLREHGEGPLLLAALEAELVRLLSANGLAITSSGAEGRITAREIQVQPDTTVRQLGRYVGRSLYASLNQSISADKPLKCDVPWSVPAQSAAPMQHGLRQCPGASASTN